MREQGTSEGKHQKEKTASMGSMLAEIKEVN